MLGRRFWFIGIGIVLIAALLGAVFLLVRTPGVLPKAADGPRDSLSLAETALLRDGDIIVRKGVGSASDLVSTMVGEGMNISHCGMVRLRQGEPWVVHTLNGSLTGIDGVQAQGVAEFNRLSAPGSIAVFRPRLTQEQRRHAVGYLDQVLAEKRPFDNDYDLGENQKMYCAELLLVILQECGFYPADFKPAMVFQFLSFKNFMDKAHFDLLMCHNVSLKKTVVNR